MQNKKSKYALIVFFLFTIISVYPQATAKMLEKAYKHQSIKELKNFFYAWSKEVPPITGEELATYSDTIQQAYKAFVALYKPYGGEFIIIRTTFRISFTSKICCTEQEVRNRINNWRIADSIKSKYLENLERNDDYIKCRWCDNRSYNEKLTHLIEDFRPAFQANGKVQLFLTKKHEKILSDFLGIGNKDMKKEEIEKRKNFLENCIKVSYIGMGGEFLSIIPQSTNFSNSIVFDKDMEYFTNWSGGVSYGEEYIYKKKGDTWVYVTETGASYIE